LIGLAVCGERDYTGIMASEIIEYRGYELYIESYGPGFKARIRKSGSLFDRPELPYSENKTQREQIIAEAMAIVDTLLDVPHKKKQVDSN
jgi:hypothetical protein